MTEIETIKAIRRLFPLHPDQSNQCFTADAELVSLEGGRYAFSLDEFSQEEDFFDDHDLRQLGRNLAVATISDILATGCRPRFYLHSITEPYSSKGFAVSLSEGVSDILNDCGGYLLGGDLGRGEAWRYAAVALGRSEQGPPLTRILPPRPQKLWLTGSLGDGNLCAFTGRDSITLELRLREAEALRGLATACLDTSGGLLESLRALALVNAGRCFHIDSPALPYDPRVRKLAAENGLPLAGFAFGGAGEYELLFSTDEDAAVNFAACIGRVETGDDPGLYWDGTRLPDNLPDPRAHRDKQIYIREILELIKSCRI